MVIQLKRAYEQASLEDGKRILVERLWPRGLKKEKAKIDEWLKDVAPSTELRKWYGHDPSKWLQFKQRYWKELESKNNILSSLCEEIKDEKDLYFQFKRRETEQCSSPQRVH
jgi:uncharacterized protein YeaO (DUF488 family)